MTRSALFNRLTALPAAIAAGAVVIALRLAAPRDDAGQATAEYALVLLGAAAIAMAIVSWVSKANPIGSLFDMVLGGLFRKAK